MSRALQVQSHVIVRPDAARPLAHCGPHNLIGRRMRTSFLLCIAVSALVPSEALATSPITVEEVVQVEGASPTALYTAARTWFATEYTSANDVIQMDDPEAGVVVGRGQFTFSTGKLMTVCYTGPVTYTIKVEVREARYKVEVTDFVHEVAIGNATTCALGLVTSAAEHSSTGIDKGFNNKVWSQVQEAAKVHGGETIASLRGAMSKANKPATQDADW